MKIRIEHEGRTVEIQDEVTDIIQALELIRGALVAAGWEQKTVDDCLNLD